MESTITGAARNLPPEDYHFILALLIVVALYSFYCFIREWKRWRLIKDTPTARLRSAPQGYVELEGKGKWRSEHPIYAPLTNHKCLWYHSRIERQETILEKKRTRTTWKPLFQSTSPHPFLLDDGTETCLVDPDGAEIISTEKLVWYGNTEWPARAGILDNGSALTALANGYRYTEQLILPGQRLYVIGELRTKSPGTERSVKNIMRELLYHWKQDKKQLHERFDTNQDGKIDQHEWEVARAAALTEARERYQQQLYEPAVHHVFKPGNSGRPFIISARSQNDLLQDCRRKTFITLAVCAGITACLLWLLQARG